METYIKYNYALQNIFYGKPRHQHNETLKIGIRDLSIERRNHKVINIHCKTIISSMLYAIFLERLRDSEEFSHPCIEILSYIIVYNSKIISVVLYLITYTILETAFS